MIARRRLDFCCLQETRWKGGSAKIIGSEGYTEAKRQAKKEINMTQEVERKKFGEMLVREDGKKNVFRVAKQMVS